MHGIEVPGVGRADAGRPVAEVISHALLVDVDRMVQHQPGTRAGTDAEDLHQMRVATRRLRTTLRTYRPVLDRSWSDGLRYRLRDVAAALGEVRDLDVRLERLDDEVLEGPAADGLVEIRVQLIARRESAMADLVHVLDSPEHTQLLLDLREAARTPRCSAPDDPAGAALSPLVATAWRRLHRAVGRRDPHAVRIRVKRLRYAAEAIEPAIGKPARRLAKAAAAAQEVLGARQDAWISRHAHLELLAAGGISPSAAFTLGVLVEREDRRMGEAMSAWPAAWKRLRAPKLRRFLTA